MARTQERADHGDFTLHSPEEDIMVVQLAEKASKNPTKPGHAWGRLEAKRTRKGRTEQGYKMMHVDLNTNRLTITEEWAGVETARKTIDLGAMPEPEVAAGPTAPPEAGSATPVFYRLPFRGADLLPEEELREWAMARAEEDVFNLSVLPRRIRLFGEGFQEIVGLPQQGAPNVAPGTGATLRALSKRRGVERRLVEGWFGSVDGRGTAWILEAGDDSTWWVAMRTFERRPGMIGVWTSAWSQRAGLTLESLSSSLRCVLDPPAGEQPIVLGAPKPPDTPEVKMTGGTLPATERVPDTAEAVAERVGRDFERNLFKGSMDLGVRVAVFRGSEWETWVLVGDFPMGLDDMIRAIAARGEPPTSLALVKMGVIPMGAEAHRALITLGEAGGRRYTRAMLIRMAPDGTVVGNQLVARDHGEVGDDGWIGVPPITEMSLFTLNSAEA